MHFLYAFLVSFVCGFIGAAIVMGIQLWLAYRRSKSEMNYWIRRTEEKSRQYSMSPLRRWYEKQDEINNQKE